MGQSQRCAGILEDGREAVQRRKSKLKTQHHLQSLKMYSTVVLTNYGMGFNIEMYKMMMMKEIKEDPNQGDSFHVCELRDSQQDCLFMGCRQNPLPWPCENEGLISFLALCSGTFSFS